MSGSQLLPWLGWMRFIAAFIVMLGHIGGALFVSYDKVVNPNIFNKTFLVFTSVGNEAVILFFVLSGYLVGGKALERIKTNNFDMQGYIIDRATRILVPLFPAIVLAILVTLSLQEGSFQSYKEFKNKVWENNAVLWSLVYEVIFYGLIIGISFYKKNNILLGLSLLIFAIIFHKLYIHYLVCWLVGALLYLIPRRKVPFLLYAGIVGAIASSWTYQNYADIYAPQTRVFLALSFAVIIHQALLINKWPAFQDMGEKLAAFSYTLYLTHYPIVKLFEHKAGLNNIDELDVYAWGMYTYVLTWCVVISWMMYVLFERNTQAIKQKVRLLF